MQADRVEVSWDAGKSQWLVRIISGEEVIRRFCKLSKDADEAAIRSAAEGTVHEEGYQVASANVTVKRESAPVR